MRSDALRAIDGAMSDVATLSEAVDRIAKILCEEYPVDRVSIRLCQGDNNTFLVAAVWATYQTKIVPGIRISKGASSFPEVVEADGPVLVTNAPLGRLLDDIIASEGLRSWITTPLRQAGVIDGLLSVSSFTPDVFTRSDIEQFASLARLIEARIFSLAG